MSAAAHRGPAVVDTNVFGADLVRRTSALAEAYRPFVEGRPVFVSFVTVAELRYGALRAGWGAPRLRRLDARLGQARVVLPEPEVVAAYAGLRHDCARVGHALAQKDHEADRWVAATAVWLGVPLVSHDGVFRGAPGLTLLTTLVG